MRTPYLTSALGRQFVILIAGVLTVALLANAYFQYEREKTSAYNKLAEKGQSIGKLLASISIAPLLIYDTQTINEFAKNTSEQYGVIYTIYLDNEKNPLTTYFNHSIPAIEDSINKAQSADPYDVLTQLKHRQDILHQDFPIIFNQQILATLHIGFDKKPLLTEPQHNLEIYLGSSLLFGIFIGLTIYIGFIRKVSRPVMALRHSAKNIIHFNFNEKIELSGNNELTDLASTFNQMRISLKNAVESRDESLEEIENLNISLEDRVRERTNALEELNAQVTHQAMHDPLTGLANRVLIIERLNQAIDYAHRNNTRLAVFILDLNNFKEINDTLGHPEGDLILRQVAKRIPGALRGSDSVGRLGGDEFAVVLPDIDEKHALEVGEKIVQVMQPAFDLSSQTVNINASIGIALYPEHGEDQAALIRHADVAMYHSKRNSQMVSVYRADFDVHTPWRLALMADLKQGLENNELELHYQPQIDIKTGQVYGVEALLRWHHPAQGLIPPDHFINIAENSGLINLLTDWVITNALKQWKSWHDTGLTLDISINISARNISNPALPETIGSLLTEYQIIPEKIKLELTESTIMTNHDSALALMCHPKLKGIKYAIDDFGTGYSSLNYLRQLPVDEVKIDKSFIFDMDKNHGEKTIVQSIIDLTHNFGHIVVAEGVENIDVLNQLKQLGCDSAQGYYIAKPAPAMEIAEIIRQLNSTLNE